MTNSEIEKRANDMLAKYVQRGGVHKVWDKIMTGENIKYRQIATSPDFVGALTKGNNGQSYIMTNAAISNDGRRNFTIAHELGHYALEHHLHSGSLFCSNDGIMEEGSTALAIEREANHFATCLLMPEEKIRKAFKSMLYNSHHLRNKDFLYVNKATFGAWCGIRDDLMKRYGVSEEALRNRLRSLRLAKFDF